MIWYQALVLGIVQGLTELLPISSSGHLVVVPGLFGWGTQPLVFDAILHLGTALALIIYFWKDLVRIGMALVKDRNSRDGKLGIYIFIGSIPAAFFGLLLSDFVEGSVRGSLGVTFFLIIGTLIMLFAEVHYKREQSAGRLDEEKEVSDKLSNSKAVTIGFFQSLALFPGTSRSGATISGGMFLGLTRGQAARFSFLLSIPIVLAAGAFKIAESAGTDLAGVDYTVLILGFLTSFIVGILAIKFLLGYLEKYTLNFFILYRVLVIAGLLYFLVK
jgi:undecaprenyl-diphosphatase